MHRAVKNGLNAGIAGNCCAAQSFRLMLTSVQTGPYNSGHRARRPLRRDSAPLSSSLMCGQNLRKVSEVQISSASWFANLVSHEDGGREASGLFDK